MENTKAPKRKRGRPSIYSPEVCEEICLRLSKGETMTRICEDDHMPSIATVFRWEIERPDFRELSSRARENGTHVMADQCISIADNPTLDPNDKRIRIDTRLRLIGKWNAKRYGDKIAMEHDHQHKFISLEELEEKVRRIELESNEVVAIGANTAVLPAGGEESRP